MSGIVDDYLLRSLDEFLEAVYWSEEPTTMEEALTEAVEDWVAATSAEHNDSRPFIEASSDDALTSGLHHLVTAVEVLADRGMLGMTMAGALSIAIADWLNDAI